MAGLDEVGRGCWAGPLVAGAVVLPKNFKPQDTSVVLRDSKKLTRIQRKTASTWIKRYALAASLGWVEPSEIDALGLSKSVRLAFTRAFAQIKVPYDEIIIDGNINYFPNNTKARAVIRADGSFPCVSAASIIAKVARDEYMAALSDRYAVYQFEKHVGYGTALHLEALRKYGPCDIHRTSFRPIQNLIASD